MDIQFTTKSQEALGAAVRIAASKGNAQVDPVHLTKVRGSARVTSADPEAQTYQALEKYSTDLTARAREGKLDPVIGRDNEIRRVIQVLSRRTKNNPVLIGEPGVGKTAIVEGLAQRIVEGDVSRRRRCKDKTVVSLDLAVHGRRRKVPRRVRGAPEGRARRDQELRRPDHHLHRRAAHHRRRRRRRRGRDGRRQHDQADAGPRRAAPASARPPSTSTASTSRRTPPWSVVSSRCSWASRRWRTPSAILRGLKDRYEVTTKACGSPTRHSSLRRPCLIATSPAASCPTRPST
jgi:hypothetical protein